MDPFTLLAQVLNFLILVLLLRRFLFKPLMGVMDERERLLNDPTVTDVTLTPLLYTPKTFMADSLASELAENIADSLRLYYRKQSVTVENPV